MALAKSQQSAPPTPPLLLRPEAAADALGVSRSRIYELLRSGELRPTRIGHSTRISWRELERFVEVHTEGPTPWPAKH